MGAEPRQLDRLASESLGNRIDPSNELTGAMGKNFRHYRALLLFSLSLWLAPALADANDRPAFEGPQWSVGLGVISSPRPYVGAEDQTRAIPVLGFESERFYLRGIQAGFQLAQRQRFSLDLFSRVRFAGFEAKDSVFLAGMEERRETIELGLAAAWKVGAFGLQAQVASDALGRGAGSQASVELAWNKGFGRGRAALAPAIGVVWQDAKFVDQYAGVRPHEARPDRPAFEGEAALSLSGGVSGFVKVAHRTRLVGLLRVERLADEFAASPIVESRWGSFGLLSIVYEF